MNIKHIEFYVKLIRTEHTLPDNIEFAKANTPTLALKYMLENYRERNAHIEEDSSWIGWLHHRYTSTYSPKQIVNFANHLLTKIIKEDSLNLADVIGGTNKFMKEGNVAENSEFASLWIAFFRIYSPYIQHVKHLADAAPLKKCAQQAIQLANEETKNICVLSMRLARTGSDEVAGLIVLNQACFPNATRLDTGKTLLRVWETYEDDAIILKIGNVLKEMSPIFVDQKEVHSILAELVRSSRPLLVLCALELLILILPTSDEKEFYFKFLREKIIRLLNDDDLSQATHIKALELQAFYDDKNIIYPRELLDILQRIIKYKPLSNLPKFDALSQKANTKQSALIALNLINTPWLKECLHLLIQKLEINDQCLKKFINELLEHIRIGTVERVTDAYRILSLLPVDVDQINRILDVTEKNINSAGNRSRDEVRAICDFFQNTEMPRQEAMRAFVLVCKVSNALPIEVSKTLCMLEGLPSNYTFFALKKLLYAKAKQGDFQPLIRNIFSQGISNLSIWDKVMFNSYIHSLQTGIKSQLIKAQLGCLAIEVAKGIEENCDFTLLSQIGVDARNERGVWVMRG